MLVTAYMENINYYYANHEFHQNGEVQILFYTSVKETAKLHTHDFFEISFLLSGRAIHYVNGEEFEIKKNDLIFMRSNDVHEYRELGDKDFKMVNISFRGEVIKDISDFLKSQEIFEQFFSARFPYVVRLTEFQGQNFIRHLLNLCYNTHISDVFLNVTIRKFVMDTFYKYIICPEYDADYSEVKVPKWFDDFYIYLQSSEVFTKKIKDIIENFGTNPDYTARLFKKITNQNISKHIAEKRLEYAYTQLLYTDDSIINIAMNSGFENLSTFYHAFNNYFGATPKEMRMLGKNPENYPAKKRCFDKKDRK